MRFYRKILSLGLVATTLAVSSCAQQDKRAFLLPILTNRAWLPPIAESEAYSRYVDRNSDSDLSLLLYLMDRFHGSDFKMRYQGNEYDSLKAMKIARDYVAKHYRGGEANAFLRKHTMQPLAGNGILYARLPDGRTVLLRDLLLVELEIFRDFLAKQ